MIALLVLAGGCLAADPAPAPPPAGNRFDFEALGEGPVPADLMVVDGEFRVTSDGDNKVLELLPTPLVDGTVLLGPSMKGGGTVRAKVRAERSRRAFPRFGVGMHGISGTKARVVPAQKVIELVHGDETIGSTAFTWPENEWLNVELRLREESGQWAAEMRVWPGKGGRPEKPSLAARMPATAPQGRCSVVGTPYANKPIRFDDVEVIEGP